MMAGEEKGIAQNNLDGEGNTLKLEKHQEVRKNQ